MAKFRRLTHLLLVLALATGVVTHAVQATDIGAKMSMAASSTITMSGMCDGCSGGNDGCTPTGTCSLMCGSVFVLPTANAGVQLLVAPPGDLPAYLAWVGWNAPPDPYPPRPSILS